MPTSKRPPIAARPSIVRVAASLVGIGAISAAIFSMTGADALSNQTSKTAVVSAVKNAKLGTILASGRTLYTLNKSDCTAKCLKYWPAFVLPKGVTKATASNGVNAAKLGTVRIANGARQVTYAGKALYFFVEDSAAGQVRGNKLTDPWGTWSIVVTAKPASSPGTPGTPVVTTVPPTTSVPVAGASPTTTSAPSSTTTPATTTTTMPKSVTTTTAPSGGGIAF
jgi:predicted lipoprotein with Yx(FWY)xxD motif